MSIFDSISRNIKNVFVGSHRGEDIKTEWLETIDTEKHKKIVSNPLDSMPIANGTNRYAPPERLVELEAELAQRVEENPRPEEDMVEWFSDKKEKPDESDVIEEEKTMHQKMYEMATARYNPFSLGGSENCDSDITCNIGGSENHIKKQPPTWEDTAPSEYEP